MNNFLTELAVTPLPDGRNWRVDPPPFVYHFGTPTGEDYVTVEAGFITDFASTPRVIWSLFPPWGKYGKAAVVHDKLYRTRLVTNKAQGNWTVTRHEADCVLWEAMGVTGTPTVSRLCIYLGVRLGGWVAWNRYRRVELGA